MTKTITELQPMIYGDLFARTWERKKKQRRLVSLVRKSLWPAYVAFGLMIVFDAGAAPWDFRFWLMFVPLFLLGEAVLLQLARTGNAKHSGVSETSDATRWFEYIESTHSVSRTRPADLVDPVITRLASSKSSTAAVAQTEIIAA
jgi:hypothetical protein